MHSTLAMLYEHDCGHDHAALVAGGGIAQFIAEIKVAFEKAAVYLHGKKKYSPQMLKDPAIKAVITTTNKALQSAISKSITSEVPQIMRDALQKNVFYFSGMKTHAQMQELSSKLLDDKGKIKPLVNFQQDAKKLNETYNDNYLRAERNFATRSAQTAAKWSKYEQGKDRYDLRYLTDNGPNVRDSHRALEFTTLPVDDPFWDKYTPPNGYNCHCFLVQVRKGEYPVSDSQEAQNKGDAATAQIGKDGKNRGEIFRFNPGKDMKVMPPNHPYTSGDCGTLAAVWQQLSVWQKVELAGKADKCRAKKVVEEMSKQDAEIKRILQLPRNEQFEEITDNKTGMTILKDKLVTPKPNDPKDDYEHLISTAISAKKKGYNFEILPTLPNDNTEAFKKIFNGYSFSNKYPDFRDVQSGEFLDLKRPSAIKNILNLANKSVIEKNAIAVISDVYLNKELNENIIKQRVDAIFGNEHYKFNSVYFIVKGEALKYNRP